MSKHITTSVNLSEQEQALLDGNNKLGEGVFHTYSEDEARCLIAAIRTQIKSHERSIRLHQTQGRSSMADIYLEEGRILQGIIQKLQGGVK